MKIDFHCHSFYSDGECSPLEIFEMALKHQVEALALTDHDSIQGYHELTLLAKNHPIKIIPGLECSVSWQNKELHVLGLGVEPDNAALLRMLQRQAQRRFARAIKIAELLTKLGVKTPLASSLEIAGHYGLTRSHFAKCLLSQGKVSTHQMAFQRYLGERAPAYVPAQWESLAETVEVIQQAQGIAVLAHPMHYGLSTAHLKGLLQQFKALGGLGIEVISGTTSAKDCARLTAFATNLNLSLSSGSDFHRVQSFRPQVGGQAQLQNSPLSILAAPQLQRFL